MTKKKMKRSRSRSKTALPQKHEKPTLEMVLQHVPEARKAGYIETPSAACLSLVALGIKLTAIETLPDTMEGASGTCGQLPKSSFFFDALRALVFKVAQRLSIADVGEFSYTSNAPWEPDNINVHWRSPNVYNVFFNSEGRRENLSFSKDGGSFEPLTSIVTEGRPFREQLRSLDLLLATKFLPGCGRLRQEGRLQINGRSLEGATLCTTLRELSHSDSGVRIYAKPFKMAAARAASRDSSEGGLVSPCTASGNATTKVSIPPMAGEEATVRKHTHEYGGGGIEKSTKKNGRMSNIGSTSRTSARTSETSAQHWDGL